MTGLFGSQFEMFGDVSNPLDGVEEMLAANEWVFSRLSEEELEARIEAHHGAYRLTMFWQEEFSTMQFSCEYDLDLPEARDMTTARVLMHLNAGLWLGHFDLQTHNRKPCFRHTALFRGMAQASGAEHIHDLIDIALAECERYYPLFHFISQSSGDMDAESLALAMADSAGES